MLKTTKKCRGGKTKRVEGENEEYRRPTDSKRTKKNEGKTKSKKKKHCRRKTKEC